MNRINITSISSEYDTQFDCAKITAKLILDKINHHETEKITNLLIGFDKGFDRKSICGALSGSIITLNYLLQDANLNPDEINDHIDDLKSEFINRYGFYNCCDLNPKPTGKNTAKIQSYQKCHNMIELTTNFSLDTLDL
ncbi:MAG: C-GCAxxG-C-C family protein [Candidatus Heimdallarchaeota archaeon]|nr:C-GCAxxG-C-C family protein [Candidatus Heimdallarchaeota archaeon]MDH5646569.1 C-GCAxxG-C-C family protein [Candidatus Heimdallarchaeota archaeon]